MKKLFSICLVIMVLSMAIAPQIILAELPDIAPSTEVPFDTAFPTEGPKTGGDIIDLMGAIGNWLFAIFMGIALIFIVIGAMQFVTGGGDPTKVSEARQKMIWAAVGIGFALLAAFFDDILGSIINVSF